MFVDSTCLYIFYFLSYFYFCSPDAVFKTTTDPKLFTLHSKERILAVLNAVPVVLFFFPGFQGQEPSWNVQWCETSLNPTVKKQQTPGAQKQEEKQVEGGEAVKVQEQKQVKAEAS